MKDEPQPTSRELLPVILVLAGPPDERELQGERHSEMHNLLDTAGREVLATCEQHAATPSGTTYLGKGKVAELKELVRQVKAEEVIFDISLSPRQQRNLEEELGVSVLDYDELILDIFARNARTSQAMLAVELAQMEYTRGRLRRLWTHLDRQRIGASGGTGSGFKAGTGEKQIEMDRRLVKKRIQDLKSRLAVIEARTDRTLATRSGCFKVALVGYTNAGKSTLMNALTGAGVLAEDRLFATLDTRSARLPLDDLHREVVLSDTVGFIRKLPPTLIASFHATLAEVREADLLLHVVDSSSQVMEDQITAVDGVLTAIAADQVPTITVFNKLDRAWSPTLLASARRRRPRSASVSALTGEGLDVLRRLIAEAAAAGRQRAKLSFAAADGRLSAQIRSRAMVLKESYRGDCCHLLVEADPVLLDQVRSAGAKVALVRGR